MLSSTGADRIKGDGTKAGWSLAGGEVDGTLTGTAVLMHRTFRFPQPASEPQNPQLMRPLCRRRPDPSSLAKPLVLRLPVRLIRDGKPDAALLDRLLHDYANPAKVTVALSID